MSYNIAAPYKRLHVTILTKRGAERWTRHAYNVPDHVGLGWRPYRYLVTSPEAISICAFYRASEFRRWREAQGFKVEGKLVRGHGHASARSWAVASLWLTR